MVTYVLLQPKSLEKLAIVQFGVLVAKHADDLQRRVARLQLRYPNKAQRVIEERIELIRNHVIQKAPKNLHNKLTVGVMRALNDLFQRKSVSQDCNWNHTPEYEHMKHVIGQMIEVLFTNNLTEISFADNAFDSAQDRQNMFDLFKDSFFFKSSLFTGVTHLEMGPRTNEIGIIPLLQELRNLKYVNLAFECCSESIVQCIADNCERIETLQIADPSFVSYDVLNRFPKLRIDLQHLKLSYLGIAELLMYCDNIEDIEIIPTESNSVLAALLYISSFEENVGKTFKLKSFTNGAANRFMGITKAQVKLVVKMCPLIERVSLYNIDWIQDDDTDRRDYINYLKPLSRLENLKEVELFENDFYAERIDRLLRVRGRGLVHLRLDIIHQTDMDAWKYICLMCPNLQSLTLRILMPRPDLQKHELFLSAVEIPPLRHLKKLTFTGVFRNLPEDEFIFLLSSCPNIEHIDLGNLIEPIAKVERAFLKTLKKNPKAMIYLKTLSTHKFKISTRVIDKLVQNCVNLLEVTCVYYSGF